MMKHIKPLPISEEMLGAYLEGNLAQNYAQYIELMLKIITSYRHLVFENVGNFN